MAPENNLLGILEKQRYLDRRGAFYGGVKTRPLGSGIILRNCRFPLLDPESKKYRAARGYAYVLTHECDIDSANDRSFNDKLLILPIIDFRSWYLSAEAQFGEETAKKTAVDIVADKIYRVFFLPTIPGSPMEYGGFLYFNEMTNTDLADVTENAEPICSLSDYSHRILSIKLENHLLRPKSAPLMIVN